MASKVLNPLNANDLAGAQAVIDSAEAAYDLARRCTNCGYDVSTVVAQIDALVSWAKAVQANFGQTQTPNVGS